MVGAPKRNKSTFFRSKIHKTKPNLRHHENIRQSSHLTCRQGQRLTNLVTAALDNQHQQLKSCTWSPAPVIDDSQNHHARSPAECLASYIDFLRFARNDDSAGMQQNINSGANRSNARSVIYSLTQNSTSDATPNNSTKNNFTEDLRDDYSSSSQIPLSLHQRAKTRNKIWRSDWILKGKREAPGTTEMTKRSTTLETPTQKRSTLLAPAITDPRTTPIELTTRWRPPPTLIEQLYKRLN